MICEVCNQRNADIVFKTVTGNQVATKAMCMACAQTIQQDMMKMFMALGLNEEQKKQGEAPVEPAVTMPRFLCTQCGRPYDSLGENTMAGCAACYDAMREDLIAHSAANADTAVNQQAEDGEALTNPDEVQELRYQMLEAVINEQYETAAMLRDRIQRAEQTKEQAH